MLDAIANPELPRTGVELLPADHRHERADRAARRVTSRSTRGCRPASGPLVFPTLDDQAAGLIGGGAVDAGQVAIILGNSAVVNSSSAELPAVRHARRDEAELGAVPLDAVLLERAQFLDRVVGRTGLVQARSRRRDGAAAVQRQRACCRSCCRSRRSAVDEAAGGVVAGRAGRPGVRVRACLEAHRVPDRARRAANTRRPGRRSRGSPSPAGSRRAT